MFERFTERARRVILLSQEEARRLNRAVEPEHVLLGIVAEQGGIG
ncbi:MAG: Clp protease N-terminal domain-containing protein, partial [bacterium]